MHDRKYIAGLAILIVLFGYQTWQILKIKSEQGSLLEAINAKQHDEKLEVAPAPASPRQAVAIKGGDEINSRLTDLEEILSETLDKLDQISTTQQALQAKEETELVSVETEPPSIETEESSGVSAEDELVSFEDRSALMDQVLSTNRDNDPVWANATMVSIAETMRSNELLSMASNSYVDCGATLCKIDTTIPSSLDNFKKQEFQWSLLMALGQELPSYTYSYEDLADGSQRLIFYMGRKGYALPQPEQTE